MKDSKVWIGLCAVVALSGCASGLVSSWKAPDAEPFRLRGEKVAAVVMANDQTIRLAGEEALARNCRARIRSAPMHTLSPARFGRSEGARGGREAGVLGSSCCDRYASTRKSRRGRPTRADVRRILGGFYGHGWGSAWSTRDSYRHHHHVETLVLVDPEQAVWAAKQDANRSYLYRRWRGRNTTDRGDALDPREPEQASGRAIARHGARVAQISRCRSGRRGRRFLRRSKRGRRAMEIRNRLLGWLHSPRSAGARRRPASEASMAGSRVRARIRPGGTKRRPW